MAPVAGTRFTMVRSGRHCMWRGCSNDNSPSRPRSNAGRLRMSGMPFRGAGPVGPSAGVHHWTALPSGVKVSDDEVNTAERDPSHANHQNENVPGTHTRPLQIPNWKNVPTANGWGCQLYPQSIKRRVRAPDF